jgi:hypothetical protein
MDDKALGEAARTWREEGWALVPSLIEPEVIDAAMADVWQVFPTPEEFYGGQPDPRRDGFYLDRDPLVRFAQPASGPAFRKEQLLGMREFPGRGLLNRLVVHPRLLAFVREALGADEVQLYLAELWAKYAGVTDYEQPMHRDPNHSLLPPRSEPGCWHLEAFLYLSDVDERCAPTRLVPLSAVPKGAHYPDPASPAEAPQLYGAEISALGGRGSLLAYRTDVWHRGTDLTGECGARFVLGLSFKLQGQDWVGYNALPPKAPDLFFKQFVAASTPDELAVLGIPRPGHPIWNDALVDAFAARYPGLDVTAWRDALIAGPPRG